MVKKRDKYQTRKKYKEQSNKFTFDFEVQISNIPIAYISQSLF
jgi:hypothetical protein